MWEVSAGQRELSGGFVLPEMPGSPPCLPCPGGSAMMQSLMTPGIQIPWEHLQLSLRRVYEGPPRSRYDQFCATGLYLSAWYIKKGSVSLRHQEGTFRAGEGHWVFPRVTPRYQLFAPGTEICSLAVDVVWPDGRPLFDQGLPAAFRGDLPEARRLHSLFKKILRLFEKTTPELERYLALQVATYQWMEALHALFSAHGIPPDDRPFLNDEQAKIVETLRQWPLNKPYSAEKMAHRLGLSRAHFERICLRALGKSPKRYFDERRLGHAMTALTLKSVKEVAAETGFGHASTFSAWFKKHTGIYPRALKEREGRTS